MIERMFAQIKVEMFGDRMNTYDSKTTDGKIRNIHSLDIKNLHGKETPQLCAQKMFVHESDI